MGLIVLAALPIPLAVYFLHCWGANFHIPIFYNLQDALWQLILTKTVIDTGWVLNNPYLGAPGVAHWYTNAAAQTSALHSVIMYGLSFISQDPVWVQQIYFFANFSIITLTAFFACRILGIARLPSAVIGVLFAFCPLRINSNIYAFIPNYFIVPLAIVPVIWLMQDGASASAASGAEHRDENEFLVRLRSSRVVFSIIVIVLLAVSDGYYAFFELLLLGYVVTLRALSGEILRPRRLLLPTAFIALLLCTALLLEIPLYSYRNAHRSEFYPNGVEDAIVNKHASEAEVYSSSLKMLIAPSVGNRIEPLARLGKWMIQTADAARRYPYDVAYASIGTLTSLLLVFSFVLLGVAAFRAGRLPATLAEGGVLSRDGAPLLWPVVALVFFVFLCSISGGIGTLIALLFPSIRVYNRFPLFLVFLLYLGAGSVATALLARSSPPRRRIYQAIILVLGIAALFDQVPANVWPTNPAQRAQWRAEGAFVRRIEAELPENAMVYNYPYGQYQRESKYYGWGSWAASRLYLHSHGLRWSAGASRNSPSDLWNELTATLPIDQLVTEIRAVGFRGLVVDRTVIRGAQYASVKRALIQQTGVEPIENDTAHLAFWRLPEIGYRLEYR